MTELMNQNASKIDLLVNEIGAEGAEIHSCTFHAFAQLQTMKYFQEL